MSSCVNTSTYDARSQALMFKLELCNTAQFVKSLCYRVPCKSTSGSLLHTYVSQPIPVLASPSSPIIQLLDDTRVMERTGQCIAQCLPTDMERVKRVECTRRHSRYHKSCIGMAIRSEADFSCCSVSESNPM